MFIKLELIIAVIFFILAFVFTLADIPNDLHLVGFLGISIALLMKEFE